MEKLPSEQSADLREHKQDNEQNDDEDFIILPSLTPQELSVLEAQHLLQKTKFYQTSKPYELQNWYKPLKDYTFHSQCVDLTFSQAYLLNKLYYKQDLHEGEKQLIQKLKRKIDQLFKGQIFKAGCFMKLSTRSPKDYCWNFTDQEEGQKFEQLLVSFLNEKLKKLHSQKQQQLVYSKTQQSLLLNSIYQFILKQTRDKIKISSGQQFLKVFSGSDRIIQDIQQMSYICGNPFSISFSHTNPLSTTPLTKLWCRQWLPYPWHQQFRCFYRNLHLTAISQYDQRCFFQQLQGKQVQDRIRDKIVSFFDKIPKKTLKDNGIQNGVMDVVVVGLQGPVIMVEVNPFDQWNTRGSLFKWRDDKQIIEGGIEEKERIVPFRILKQSRVEKEHLGRIMGPIDKELGSVVRRSLKKVGLEKLWE